MRSPAKTNAPIRPLASNAKLDGSGVSTKEADSVLPAVTSAAGMLTVITSPAIPYVKPENVLETSLMPAPENAVSVNVNVMAMLDPPDSTESVTMKPPAPKLVTSRLKPSL